MSQILPSQDDIVHTPKPRCFPRIHRRPAKQPLKTSSSRKQKCKHGDRVIHSPRASSLHKTRHHCICSLKKVSNKINYLLHSGHYLLFNRAKDSGTREILVCGIMKLCFWTSQENHGWVDDWPAMCLCPNACESFQCHWQDPRWCFPPSMHVVCSSLHPSAHPSPPKFSHLPLPLWKTGSRIRTHTSYHNIDSSTLPRILQTLESVWHCDFYTCITLSTETTNLTSYWRSGEFFHPRVVTTFFEYLISGKGEDHSLSSSTPEAKEGKE